MGYRTYTRGENNARGVIIDSSQSRAFPVGLKIPVTIEHVSKFCVGDIVLNKQEEINNSGVL